MFSYNGEKTEPNSGNEDLNGYLKYYFIIWKPKVNFAGNAFRSKAFADNEFGRKAIFGGYGVFGSRGAFSSGFGSNVASGSSSALEVYKGPITHSNENQVKALLLIL